MITEEVYWRHPCQIGRQRYPSLKAAAEATGIPYGTLYNRCRSERRGYKLLPYDGVLPTFHSIAPAIPHVYAEGVWFYSQEEAAGYLGVSPSTVNRRIRSSTHPDYYVHLVG